MKTRNPVSRKFAFRIKESDYQMLKTKAKRGNVTMTSLIVSAVTDKEIVVIDGLRDVLSELKAIGRNLNQLTTLCNMGRIECLRLDEIKEDFNQLLGKILTVTGEES